MDAIGLILTSLYFLTRISQYVETARGEKSKTMTLEMDLETLRTAELKEAFDEFDKVAGAGLETKTSH